MNLEFGAFRLPVLSNFTIFGKYMMDYEFKMLIPGWSFGYKFKYFWDTTEKFTDKTIFLTKLTLSHFLHILSYFIILTRCLQLLGLD